LPSELFERLLKRADTFRFDHVDVELEIATHCVDGDAAVSEDLCAVLQELGAACGSELDAAHRAFGIAEREVVVPGPSPDVV
jgi:hypothetical protein